MKSSKETKHGDFYGKRSTTIRHEYADAVLGCKPDLDKLKKNYRKKYEKYGINVDNCAYCGNKATGVDHIYSIINDSKFSGYTNDLKNLIPACQSCNSSKGSMNWDEWLDSGYERANNIKSIEGYADRIKYIKKYVKDNNSKEKMPDKVLKKLNKGMKKINRIIKKIDDEAEKYNKKYEKLKEKYKEQ